MGDQASSLTELVFQSLADPLIVADQQGRIVLANDSAHGFFTLPDPDISPLNLPVSEVITDQALLTLFSVNGGKAASHAEVTHRDGRVFSARGWQVSGVGCAVILHEITDLKRVDHQKNELVLTISHDLRSPLTAILSYADLMPRFGNLTEDQLKFTQQMKLSVERMKALINDLLEMGKLEAGLNERRHLLSLVGYADDAVRALAPKAALKNQRLAADLPDHALHVVADPLQIGRVFSNLIENAIKYTPEGGQITVRVWGEADQVMCAVSDTGIGIPVEDQPHIFDKFYRVGEIADAYEGTGLGLSIVKTIVEAHNGRIWVESHPGEGTTFTIVLPTSKSP